MPTLHHRAMSIINALKKIKNFLPRHSLLVLYRVYPLPILEFGDIIFDNCTATDSNLLESVQTAAAKLMLGCLRTTSHEIILKELCLTPLFVRRQFHILTAFRAILFGPCPSSYPPLLQSFLKIFPTTFHASIRTFSYPPVKHIPYIILFSMKAQNSGILYPLTFII